VLVRPGGDQRTCPSASSSPRAKSSAISAYPPSASLQIAFYLHTHSLTVHHTIEEQHIFPVLARKMPAFQKELELLTQHKQIHQGLDKLEKYLEECSSGERELRLTEMKEVLESFGEILWQHLDDEVEQLKAENMRKYWSLEEMRRIPM
jgi:hemerythrin-like domain-containing protein